MEQWIKEKLEVIDGLYPPARLERSRERWRRLWSGCKPLDRYPFVFSPAYSRYYDEVLPREQCLRAFLDEFILHGQFDDDFIPAFPIACRMGVLPSLFGAREVVCGKDYSCEKILFGYGDIKALPQPAIGPGTPAQDILDRQLYYMHHTEGRVAVHVADMQGPLDVCAQLWGYDNLLISAYEEPQIYVHLMSSVTEAFTLFWRAQRQLLGSCFLGTHLFAWDWIPEDAGATLSADSLAMLSPKFFQEHVRPFLLEITSAFGGLTVHSCGDFSAVLPDLCAMPGVKAINSGQMTVERLLAAGFDTTKVLISFEGIDYVGKAFNQIRTHGLKRCMTICGLWPAAGSGSPDLQAWSAEDWRKMRRAEQEVLDQAHRL